MLKPEHVQQIYALFEAALKIEPAGRPALFAKLCTGDAKLRVEVERLLAQDAEAERDRFLESSASTCRDALRRDRSPDGISELCWKQSAEGTSADYPTPAGALPAALAEHPDYEIKRELGQGGVGLVYLAENRLLGRLEVLKVMGRQIMECPGVLERFLREIRAVAKLRHPNIVAAYHATRLGDSIVFAMEYVDGSDLSRIIKRRGPLPVSNACNYVHQAALGLQHAHEHAMVHRDIKPSNLMLTRQGDRDVVKVLDFGLAKVSSEKPTDWALTYEGQMLGTPDFIAPEQIRDARQADIRADIYSLGGTLYSLLTGGPPFHGTSLYDIFQAHHSSDVTPLNEVRSDVPVELAALVNKMMAKEPERRFEKPADVATALTPFLVSGAIPGSGSSFTNCSVGQADHCFQPVCGESAPAQLATPAGASTSPPRSPSQPNANEVPAPNVTQFEETQRPPAAVKPKPTVAPSRAPALRRPWVWASAAAAVLLFALGVAVVVKLKTRNGTIVFENLPEKSVITVDGDSVTVEWPDGKGKGQAQITIPPGKHSVQLQVNGIQVSGEEVRVKAGMATPFLARIDRPPPVGKPDLPSSAPPAPAGKSAGSAPERVKNSVGMTLQLIPAGTFDMGSGHPPPAEDERPPHSVRISSPFYLGTCEVTQQQYGAIMDKNPSHFGGRSNNPVDDVTWIDAVTFCNNLSKRESLPPYYRIANADDVRILGRTGYRLPTEAEWEYACRAGNRENIPFLNDHHGHRFAWMASNSNQMTNPVGKKAPNAYGLFDMYGNVWEWCWDWAGPYPAGALTDPAGPAAGTQRVLRGNGWWNGDYQSTRPSFRLGFLPRGTSPHHDFGFRVAAGGADGLPIITAVNPAPTPGE